MPRLSIIMPVYNTSKHLKRSIDSVINQTYKDWQLILVNDGSSDNSADICREYADKDHRVIFIDKENGGAGSARNAGLDAASGEYIAFPDSDDWLDPDAYEMCISILDKTPVDLLVFGEITTVYGSGSTKPLKEINSKIRERYYKSSDECRKNWVSVLFEARLNPPWNKIYKKSIIDKYSLRFPDLRRMQDGVFNMYYYDKIESLRTVCEYKYHFLWHMDNVRSKKLPDSYIDCAIAYHSTAEKMLCDWGETTPESELKFGNWFSETLEEAEKTYVIGGKRTFANVYATIRRINNDPYIHNFYKKLSKLKKLSKTEFSMAHRLNLLLSLKFMRIK